MRLLTLLVLLLLSAPALYAQSGEGVAPASLKGIKRLYVDTGSNLKNKELIVREIRKSGINVEFLPSPIGAEVVLFFASEELKTATTVEARPPITGVMPDKPEVVYENIEFGTGTAYVPPGSGGAQVLFRWEGQRKFMSKAATKFASAFVREYKKANRIR